MVVRIMYISSLKTDMYTLMSTSFALPTAPIRWIKLLGGLSHITIGNRGIEIVAPKELGWEFAD